MSFSKGVAAMSVHSLLGPSNSESFPEVDLVSTVRMAWLPPQVKYWISNLDARDKKKKEIKILPLLPLLLPFSLPSLRVVISEQLAVRIEQDTVMTLAEGDPNRQIGSLQAGAGLFARFSVALVHQKSYLAPCQDSPLRHSLGDCGGNKNRGWRRGASNLRMCLRPQRATPRCEGGGKHGLSTRRPPRLWSPPLDSRSTSSPLDFPGQFSLWGKLLIVYHWRRGRRRILFVAYYLERPLESTALYSSSAAPGLPSSWNCGMDRYRIVFEKYDTFSKLTKYKYRLINISKSSKDSNSNKWSWELENSFDIYSWKN